MRRQSSFDDGCYLRISENCQSSKTILIEGSIQAVGEDGSREPLLDDDWHGQGDTGGNLSRPTTLLGLVLPVIAGCVVHAAETVCYFPAVSAVALCCYSMVEPSIFSAGA